MTTERLYYSDSYLTKFSASVVDLSADSRRVYLDRTAFYPASGGQPNDRGSINGQLILDIVDEEIGIAHVLAEPLESRTVQGEIDWTRRFDHMQQHTGQHLLSAVLLELFGYRTLSFHMGETVSTIELETKELSPNQVEEAELRCNALIWEAHPVTIEFEEADQVQNLRKPSARSGTLRIINIHGVDRSACGGTHVRSTAGIGMLQIRRSEKVRGNIRVEFLCGGRALKRARQDFQIALQLAQSSAVSIDALPGHFAALRVRLTEAEKERTQFAEELARRDGDGLHHSTSSDSDGLRRVLLNVPAIDAAIRTKAQAFVSHGRAVALVISTDPAACLIACSADSGVNAGAILKGTLSKFGARGGGSATLAQGNLPNVAVSAELQNALGLSK